MSRRFAQVSSDDEEDDYVPATKSKGRISRSHTEKTEVKREKKVNHDDVVVEEKETEEEEKPDDARPIGESVKVTGGKGKGRRTHFAKFEYDGNIYELEDSVLVVSEDQTQKPYVAIIKDITQTKDGSVMILGQWFYRPEEAEKKGGGNWQTSDTDTRELFYSFHRDEVPAESVIHRCIVHFLPAHKQLPKRKVHPGFIVQKVYDTVEKKLQKLTDKDYEYFNPHEIDLLVAKSMTRLGDLPDLEPEEMPSDEQENLSKAKRASRKFSTTPVDVRKEEDGSLKAETPGSGPATSSEHYAILEKFDSLTGDAHRDKCLGKLLEAVQHVCYTVTDNKEAGHEVNPLKDETFRWPDIAVPPVCALEKATHASLANDYHKYNQKMRTLVFNLKNTAMLARRLVNGELKPAKILNMSPIELKEGFTVEETEKREHDDTENMQMTDAKCSRCSQIKVGLRDIIQAGHGDRYQLECIACGHSWYALRDEVSTLTIGTDSEAVEKKPRDESMKTIKKQ